MSLRALGIGLLVVLTGCSGSGNKKGDAPERLDSEAEVIHSVSAEPAQAEPKPAPRVAAQPAPRQGPAEPVAPMAGRVGVLSLLGNELRHVHASTFGGHEKDYNVQYDFNGYVMEELRKALLAKTPYQPVAVASTGLLRRDALKWAATWNGQTFAPDYQREFDGIIKQNRLAMLIVVSYANMGDGQLIGGRTLHGSGLYTRGGLGGTKAAVFSTLQFYRLVGAPAKLVQPLAPAGERSIGDLTSAQLPDQLKDLPPRYLVPVYEPLRTLVQNKVFGLVSLPRKLGH